MKPSRLLSFSVLCVCLVFLHAGLVAAQKSAVPVKTATAINTQVAPEGEAPGTVEAVHRPVLKAESAGRVEQVAGPGTIVAEGETVATLVDPVYALRLQEMRQAVASIEARVGFLQAESERLASMVRQQLASEREVEQNHSDLAQARSDLQAATARLRQLQSTIQRLSLTAPFDAVVTERLAHVGDYVRAGDSVAQLISRQLQVSVFVPVSVHKSVKTGQQWKVIVTGENKNKQPPVFLATVRAVVPSASPNTRRIQVLLEIPSSWQGNLVDGQAVVVRYPLSEPVTATLVPRDSLVLRQSGAYIFRVQDGRAVKTPVVPGVGWGDWVAVTADGQAVQAGTVVVVRGNERLRAGQAVREIERIDYGEPEGPKDMNGQKRTRV